MTKGASLRPFFIVIAGLFNCLCERKRGNPGKSKTQKSKGKMRGKNKSKLKDQSGKDFAFCVVIVTFCV